MPFLDKFETEIAATALGKYAGVKSAFSWARDLSAPVATPRPALNNVPLPPGLDRQICANADCASRWRKPWKNRRRAIFEDNWCCTTRCLETVVRKALRRERGDASSATFAAQHEEPHRHRIPLGLVMLSQGTISQAQLRKALDAQRAAGTGRIGQWLIKECGIAKAQIVKALAMQWSCPVLPMDGFEPTAMALTMPRLFIEEFGLLPLRVAGGQILYLAFKDRLNAAVTYAMEQMSGLRVENGLIDEVDFDAARTRVLESKFVTAGQEFVSDTDTLATKIAGILEQTQPVGSRLVRVHHHYWLRTWLESGAYSGTGRLPATGEDTTDILFTLGARA